MICVAGVLLAICVPAFMRSVRASKVSEAAENLELLYQRSAAYYTATHAQDEGLAQTGCLPTTAGPTPRIPTEQAQEVDFQSEDVLGHDTWRALEFQPTLAVRFSYSFEPSSSGCGLRGSSDTYLLTMRAEGDLDGDGERSVFERRAAVDETQGTLIPFGIYYSRDRVE